MEKNNMSENEAHRYVQKSAMDSGRTMVDTAASIPVSYTHLDVYKRQYRYRGAHGKF